MMKLSRIAYAVAVAAGAMVAGQAQAVDVCQNCLYTAAGATYLGVTNPLISDSAGFRRQDLGGPGSGSGTVTVTDTWLFTMQPTGAAQITASFTPFAPSAFNSFTVSLYSVTLNPGLDCAGTANATGSSGFCAGYSTIPDRGALIVSGSPSFTLGVPSGSAIFPVTLAAGNYAMEITYNFSLGGSGTSQYSGQIFTSAVPEPGTLALAGLALFGMAAGLRRARKA